MATPGFEEFGDAMARVEEALPAPDEQGRRAVTAQQIEKVKGIIDEFFRPLFESLVKKVLVELDGEEHFLNEQELNEMPLGTIVRFEGSLFVRCAHNWLELRSRWNRTNAQVFRILSEDNVDCSKIVVTTLR